MMNVSIILSPRVEKANFPPSRARHEADGREHDAPFDDDGTLLKRSRICVRMLRRNRANVYERIIMSDDFSNTYVHDEKRARFGARSGGSFCEFSRSDEQIILGGIVAQGNEGEL
ncbi:hypothetical protein Zmor_009943 [Zophobas morio]|uniref:Uncharacterized protein n=1 Tax=Zophobas morio TaxID=2755281 RepID=A0AA38IN30_9CUCU|nr:hypothetical protein Zmor_009943 [Zophobas morio]